jgi:nitronate monooxygenase
MEATWAAFSSRFRIPLIAAPMTGASGFDLVQAAAAAGIGASFPVHNAGSPNEVDRWLTRLGDQPGPVIPNVLVHKTNTHLNDHLAVLAAHQVPAVITSVGSPQPVIEPLHDAGVLVLSDVASMRHVEGAIAAGTDGLVLLTAGAGGQTGWANPLAFARAVRRVWDGPMILAGGISDGASLVAALVLGYDLAYMGTGFIATTESAVPQGWKEAVVAAGIDDIELTDKFTGLPASMIRANEPTATTGSASAFDISTLESAEQELARTSGARYSAGHSAASVDEVLPVAEVIARLEQEFSEAQKELLGRWETSTS